MTDPATISQVSRRLRDVLEPIAGQVYFAPECHQAYERLGFGASPAMSGSVALPDGPAYFTSRGSLMGQVPGEVVASAFGVFNPAVVVPAVAMGWQLTNAETICRARTSGATAHLTRILGPEPNGLEGVVTILNRITEDLRPEGRPLFAGVSSQRRPEGSLAELFWLTDLLREFRGDSHIIAWVGAGLDGVEIGLLSELWLGLPMATYLRSRAWSAAQMDAGKERLRSRGLIEGESFTEAGLALRTHIEEVTDHQLRGVVDALGDDAGELIDRLAGWSGQIIEAGGYPRAGAADIGGTTRR